MTESEAIKECERIRHDDPRDARIAELEAALRSLVAWEGPVELAAPELGGLHKAMWAARAVLERK